ncbi:hypothetical protein Prudu_016783 [Prunus dulcis]|uniref:Transposable element protein n=1 Tax=Prunus dulcis TaxID=3755 RepID=A0A4Y1RM67_PRUDU|nr:hypothetical protein Prudu_016783 [Prunus dulcis]
MGSHDCHVFMQRLLPVGIRHLLPEDVVKPIILLSRFFSQLTAKTLRRTDMFQLRHDIVQVLCKFEMIFPPAFFTSMMHVMVHLPEEALLAGPVNYRWMYPIERLLGELKKSVRNRAKPEGSIVEAWVQYESLTFCRIVFGGVHVPGGGESTNIDFYGKLTNVVQLLYKDRYQVIMFKCRWFDTNPNRAGSVKIDHGVLSVNINRTWYDDDPYILANMATQIVYLDDPKAGSSWKVVQKMDHRNVYAIPELDLTDNDVDSVADQRLESSLEIDAETLRDTHVIQEPFQIQGVSSIEIPIQSITIDLGDLPRFDVAVGMSSEDDVVIVDEEEEDWETESDDSDDNESYYSSDDE